MELAARFLKHLTGESFFLFGARGTGKSTWCLREYSSSTRIDLLSPDVLRSFTAKPERLKEYTLGQPEGATVIINEVQKAPELLSVVHEILELKKGYKFILTGSSSRKLKRDGVDMLAGRALLRTMHPFMAGDRAEAWKPLWSGVCFPLSGIPNLLQMCCKAMSGYIFGKKSSWKAL
jgi:predicted AAA+ superfamily ATPase